MDLPGKQQHVLRKTERQRHSQPLRAKPPLREMDSGCYDRNPDSHRRMACTEKSRVQHPGPQAISLSNDVVRKTGLIGNDLGPVYQRSGYRNCCCWGLQGWLMPSRRPGWAPAPTSPRSAFAVGFFLLSVPCHPHLGMTGLQIA